MRRVHGPWFRGSWESAMWIADRMATQTGNRYRIRYRIRKERRAWVVTGWRA